MKKINRKLFALIISVVMLFSLSATAMAAETDTTEANVEVLEEVQPESVNSDYPITLSGYLGSADTVLPITTTVYNPKLTAIFDSDNSEGNCTYRITIEGTNGYYETFDTIGDMESHMYHLPAMAAGNYTVRIHRLSGKGTNYFVLMLLNNYA